jgi:glycosyltransferase involved in cell wall biosynthesis
MNVVFFTYHTKLYGSSRSLLDLLEGLKSLGVTSFVICPAEGELTRILRNRGFTTVIFPFRRWMSSYEYNHYDWKDYFTKRLIWRSRAIVSICRNLSILPFLIRKLKQWKIDLIHTNSSIMPIGALAAIAMDLPHVWHIRELGKLDYSYRHHWGKMAFEYIIKKADALIAISKYVRKQILKDIPENRIRIIYNGVAWNEEFDKYRLKAKLPPNRGEIYTFALVGVIHPNKGQEEAIRAISIVAKRYENVRLVISGGGECRHLENLSKKLRISNNVLITGYTSDPYQIYLNSDASLICSRHEAMGRVTVEAMSACRPVIGYDNGGTSEIIKNERTGLLYNKDYRDLADCMCRFLEKPQWAWQLGQNAWKEARKNYSIETYAEKVHDVLMSVCQGA